MPNPKFEDVLSVGPYFIESNMAIGWNRRALSRNESFARQNAPT